MANKSEKSPGNVPGRWYVDSSCVDCDMCRETAPGVFNRNAEIGLTVVINQPNTDAELAAAKEAKDGCPTESIGDDGDAD